MEGFGIAWALCAGAGADAKKGVGGRPAPVQVGVRPPRSDDDQKHCQICVPHIAEQTHATGPQVVPTG
jgi:hypothetical protein